MIDDLLILFLMNDFSKVLFPIRNSVVVINNDNIAHIHKYPDGACADKPKNSRNLYCMEKVRRERKTVLNAKKFNLQIKQNIRSNFLFPL